MLKHSFISKLGTLVAVLSLSTTSVAFAATAATVPQRTSKGTTTKQETKTASSTATTTKEGGKNIPQKSQGVRKDTKIEISAALNAQKKAAVSKVVTNRVNAYRKHVASLSARVTKIEQISASISVDNKADGITALNDAKAKLEHATTLLNGVQASISKALDVSTPAQSLEAIKTQFNLINADIKTAHQKIAQSIAILSGNVGQPKQK